VGALVVGGLGVFGAVAWPAVAGGVLGGVVVAADLVTVSGWLGVI
jgi:hypothetical protein